MAGSRRDRHQNTKDFIRIWCDKNKFTVDDVDWETASRPGRHWNCFGFVVGRSRWYQPPIIVDGKRRNPTDYWPEGISTATTIDAFVDAAKIEGFDVSSNGEWEEGFEIIVLYYTEQDREFTHAARLKSPGIWESKLGPLSDIEHPLDGVDNVHYGTGRIFMKRPNRAPPIRIGGST